MDPPSAKPIDLPCADPSLASGAHQLGDPSHPRGAAARRTEGDQISPSISQQKRSMLEVVSRGELAVLESGEATRRIVGIPGMHTRATLAIFGCIRGLSQRSPKPSLHLSRANYCTLLLVSRQSANLPFFVVQSYGDADANLLVPLMRLPYR